MINDIISDSLTRIRNADMRRLETARLLHSEVVEALVGTFQAKGYIDSFNVVKEDKKKFISVVLEYDEKDKSIVDELKRISRPGRHVYKGKDEVKRFKNGCDTIVISTSRGVLANDEAFKAGVGDEILCTIW